MSLIKEKRFFVGDEVTHFTFGDGVVTKDVSNAFAEAYYVNYRGTVKESSASLITLLYRRPSSIMSINKSIAVVQFPSGYKDYHFINPFGDELQKGDQVVCDTVRGLSVGEVTGFNRSSAQATKHIVQVIDLSAHNERVERKKKLDELHKKMEKRRKEIQDVQVYHLLAQADPEMAEMLSQLYALEGKSIVS